MAIREAVSQLPDEVARRLERHPILGLLAADELGSILGQGRIAQYRERASVFAQGDEGTSVFAVVSGFVKLSSATESGRDMIYEIAAPGGLFGELAVICGQPRSADALCLASTRLLIIDGRQFLTTLKRNPDVLLGIVRLLTQRLQRANEQMGDTLSLEAPSRLAKTLIRLAAQHSHPAVDGLQIDVQLSQGELGNMTGLSRESINKQLAAWRDDALLAVSNKYLTLTDLPALQEIANGIG